MNPSGTGSPERSPDPDEDGPQRSTLYVAFSAVLAAAILVMVAFLLIRGFQWRAALADLRAEPGIEIMSVERVGFFKKRLLGLRDPLAPTAESILLAHNIGPHTSEVFLTEYYSLHTKYAEQRAEKEEIQLVEIRDSLMDAVGNFASEVNAKRDADLEKITQMLFDVKFPEEMKSVQLEWKEGTWHVDGQLYAPEREAFVKAAPAYVLEGELDFSDLVDQTASETSSLRELIEGPNLFATDIDEKFVHLERIIRLVADYDEVCERSDLPRVRVCLEFTTPDPAADEEPIRIIREKLRSAPHLPASRFLPDVVTRSTDNTASAHLKLVPVSP